jgi:hypothetical protein
MLAAIHGDLSGLRIVNAKDQQVPYLVERRDEPLAVPLPIPAVAAPPVGVPSTPRASAYRFELPVAGLPTAKLVLRTEQHVFEREVRLGIIRPATEREAERYAALAEARWAHADLDNPPLPLSLLLPPIEDTHFWVLISDGDNQALPLTSAQILLPAYRLRFFRGSGEGGELTLVYGRSDLAAPQYDLALLAARLIGAQAAEVGLGDEQKFAALDKEDSMAHHIFWGALIVTTLVLVGLMAILLKRAGP